MAPRYGNFMESSAAGSPFNQNNIMHNGPMCSTAPSLMSSPGPGGPPGGPEMHDPSRYSMMSSQVNFIRSLFNLRYIILLYTI